jgi:hypothetical protein
VVTTLVVDAANVVGSRPDGWWKDRAGAARRLHEELLVADTSYDVVVLVLEGAARSGPPEGEYDGLRTVHAPGSGDEAILEEVRAATATSHKVVVVTALTAASPATVVVVVGLVRQEGGVQQIARRSCAAL